jgi:hypothetical protein
VIETFSQLSPARQRLVRLMQQVNFGRIENLLFMRGEPVFKPAPRTIQAIKLGGDHGPRQEAALREFRLAAEVIEMLGRLNQLGDGRIERLDVRHGLPFFMEIEQEQTVA